jgi:hypothetical protein
MGAHLAVLRAAREAARARFVRSVAGRPEEILDHLRRALDDTVEKARKVAPALAAYGATPDLKLLLNAPADQRKAYGALERLADRYAAIRRGRDRLDRMGYTPQRDASGHFGEFKNVVELRPPGPRGLPPEPWPTDNRVHKLLWILQYDAQPWLPTPEEQDAAWEAWATENRRTMGQQLGGALA